MNKRLIYFLRTHAIFVQVTTRVSIWQLVNEPWQMLIYLSYKETYFFVLPFWTTFFSRRISLSKKIRSRPRHDNCMRGHCHTALPGPTVRRRILLVEWVLIIFSAVCIGRKRWYQRKLVVSLIAFRCNWEIITKRRNSTRGTKDSRAIVWLVGLEKYQTWWISFFFFFFVSQSLKRQNENFIFYIYIARRGISKANIFALRLNKRTNCYVPRLRC